MKVLNALGVTATTLVLLTGAAPAAVIGTLTFTQPTGTVGTTDPIPLYVTLTLDPSSPDLSTDAGARVTSGYTIADVEANLFSGLPGGVDPTTDDIYGIINAGFGCGTDFIQFDCTPGAYTWNFNFSSSTTATPGPNDTIYVAQNLDLTGGSSTTLLFGTLTPTGGSAPPGTYNGASAGYFIQIFDTTAGSVSSPLHIADVPIASTDPSATFSRDVVAPEPNAVPLFGGLVTIIALAWRKRTRA